MTKHLYLKIKEYVKEASLFDLHRALRPLCRLLEIPIALKPLTNLCNSSFLCSDIPTTAAPLQKPNTHSGTHPLRSNTKSIDKHNAPNNTSLFNSNSPPKINAQNPKQQTVANPQNQNCDFRLTLLFLPPPPSNPPHPNPFHEPPDPPLPDPPPNSLITEFNGSGKT